MLFKPATMFPVAAALRSAEGARIGEVFSFFSGPYFRGKLAYAEAFAPPSYKLTHGALVMTTNRGLLPVTSRVTLDDLARLAANEIDTSSERFRELLRLGEPAVKKSMMHEANLRRL